ncbi:MAG: TetR family transcriptional regulator [Chelatococcus sp.]|nr:MAG: TetR family transcriptional regulator [Chelatococcus sp.]
MMVETRKRSAQRTRERILQAAMLHFSQRSYEAARLRDIAVTVGVDVALVHRSFGSKEDLFASTLEAAFDQRFEERIAAPDMAESLSAGFFETRLDPQLGIVDPFDIIIRSLGSEQASPFLRDFVRRRYSQPLVERLGSQRPECAALILGCLGGLIIFYDILAVGTLSDASKKNMQRLLKQVIRQCAEDGSGKVAMATAGNNCDDL